MFSDVTNLAFQGKIQTAKFITIDGLSGVGKSNFAYELDEHLPAKCKHIHLDNYIERNLNKYFNAIKWCKLERRISDLHRDESLIIEGVLINQVLDRIRLSESLVRIYMLPFDNHNKHEQYQMINELTLEEIKTHYETEAVNWPAINFAFESELATYHTNYNPESNADYLFKYPNWDPAFVSHHCDA